MERCPNCDGEMEEINFDRVSLGEGVKVVGCAVCKEIFQLLPRAGGLVPLTGFLDAVARGDDRVMSAISKPVPTTLKSFLELYNITTHRSALDLASLGSALMAHLAQVENLLDSAISGLAEMAMVPGMARDVYAQIQQAREMISTKPPKQRGVKEA